MITENNKIVNNFRFVYNWETSNRNVTNQNKPTCSLKTSLTMDSDSDVQHTDEDMSEEDVQEDEESAEEEMKAEDRVITVILTL